MESGEENTAANSKRPRAPLSDSEDNVLLPSETQDGQKRRRLESAAGQENRSPTPSSSGRRAELDVKPDTPAITSVRSRLQLLSQTRPGGPILARAESDPGSAGSPSVFLQDSQGFRQQLLGEGEFNQRLERFRAPSFEPSTAAGHHQREASCPRSLSNFVSDIHQKIQGNVTPSSKEASRIRQEREQEVRLLVSQPIADNVWLKRSNSDPSLAELLQMFQGKTSPGPSSDCTAPPPTRSMRIWPPSQALDVDRDAEMKDGSYSEDFAASTEMVQPKTTELEHSGQVEMECKEPEATEERSLSELATTDEQSALVLATTEEKSALELATTDEQSALELATTDEQSALELAAIGAQSASDLAASDEESVSLLAVIEEQGLFTTEEQSASEVATSEEQSASEVATSEEQSASEVATSEEQSASKVATSEEQSASEVATSEEQSASEVATSEEQSASEVATSEEQSASEVATSEEQSASEVATSEEQSASASPAIDEQRTKEAFKVTAEKDSVSIEENELSYGEETEPSTDEEPRTWRYPQGGVYREVELCIVEHEDAACTKGREECNSPTEVTGFPISEELEDNMESTSAEERDGSKMLPDDLVRDQRVQFLKSTPERDPVDTVNPIEVQTLTSDAVKVEVMNVDIINMDKANSSTETQTCDIKQDMELYFGSKRGNSIADEVQAVKDGQGKDDPEDIELGSNGTKTVMEAQNSEDEFTPISMEVPLTEKCVEAGAVLSPALEREQVAIDEQLAHKNNRSHKRGILKNVSFIMEPQLIKDSTLSEMNTFSEPRRESSSSEGELNSRDEANTAELIDEMFGEVLEYAGKMESERKRAEVTEDSGISACSGEKDKMDCEKEKSEGDDEIKEDHWCEEELNASRDELTFPPTGILSPLSKSVEAVVTPLRLAVTLQSNPTSLLLTPEKLSTPPAESSPLYSIDAYRTQRQSNLPTFQSVTPTIQRKVQEKSRAQQSINVKDKILALNEEAVKLQTVINQTLQALSCCTDEEHGRGSVTEAEAEKLLLVSCEKRAALLAEVARLREERLLEAEEAGGATSSLMPCRGTVAIGNIQLPLKVEFVYSSRNRTGQPSHYFFVLIRYGPCNIVATPLATAADAENGDTISFPTSVTMKDIRSNFEIDVEVYSLSHTSGNTCSMESSSTKPRVTPRKLLNTIMHRSSNSIPSATLSIMNTRRSSSNFCLVGSHKITLASLGQSKFPLDKMKLEGKIRRLLGDEFQEKVPFLSPLEGNIYLYLGSESHSNVQHQGFLTMFEMIKEFGVWHRRFFVLDGSHMYYWNHPNDRESKAPEGSVSLSSSSSRCVKPVTRASCARPFTFELASNIVEQKWDDDSQQAAAKGWFSADTKGEQSEWMEKLNQVLLDVHTWSRHQQTTQTALPVKACSSSSMRESSL